MKFISLKENVLFEMSPFYAVWSTCKAMHCSQFQRFSVTIFFGSLSFIQLWIRIHDFPAKVNAYFSFVFISCCLQSSTEGRCSIYDLSGMWLSQADCLFNKNDRREVHSICLELYKYSLKRGFPHLFHFSLPVPGEF